jgi:hypothetical protein
VDIAKYIPRQVHIPFVGALYDLLGKAFFFVTVANFILNTRLYYYNTGDTLIRDSFSSYWLFLTALVSFGLVMLGFVWVFILPSYNSYAQKQSVIEGRSPMYELLCEMNERLKKLEKERE